MSARAYQEFERRVLSGADAARAAEKVRERKAREEMWPYEHLFPPPDSIPVHQIAAIPVPAQQASGGVLTSICSYQVPTGFKLWLKGLVQEFTSNGQPGVINPGDCLWTVDVNTPVGLSNVQATLVQGLVRVPVPLGSWVFGTQWFFDMPYEFDELDLVQSKALNINLTPGAPNWLTSAFLGFLVPALGSR